MGDGTSETGNGATGWVARTRAQDALPPPEAKYVLCVDGGGIRGILPAMLVAEIERRTAKPASEMFDLIAGTSTGGIIAMGLVMPGPDGKPAFKASDGVDIYMEHAPTIFARKTRDVVVSLAGLADERYNATGLMALLDDTFGDLRLSDALTDVLLAAYELSRRETFHFSSLDAKQHPEVDFRMADAVRSTTAAPTFFEPNLLVDPGGREHVFIDGAVFANSPAMCAFGEIERRHRGTDILMVSVGAGSQTEPIDYQDVKDWGAAHWARPLLSIVLDGAAQSSDHVLGDLLGPERYFRFQQELDEASDALDNIKPANLQALKREGERMIVANSKQLDLLCELLLR